MSFVHGKGYFCYGQFIQSTIIHIQPQRQVLFFNIKRNDASHGDLLDQMWPLFNNLSIHFSNLFFEAKKRQSGAFETRLH